MQGAYVIAKYFNSTYQHIPFYRLHACISYMYACWPIIISTQWSRHALFRQQIVIFNCSTTRKPYDHTVKMVSIAVCYSWIFVYHSTLSTSALELELTHGRWKSQSGKTVSGTGLHHNYRYRVILLIMPNFVCCNIIISLCYLVFFATMKIMLA